MMCPYFSEGGIVIYHGDCREMIPELEPVDLVLTDPQYGMAYFSGRYKRRNPHKRIYGDDKSYPMGALKKCWSITRKAILAFCRWNNLPELNPLPNSFICWKKNNWTAGDLEHAYGRQWEGVAFWPMSGHEFNNHRPADFIDVDKVPFEELLHPTQKPVVLMIKLISQHKGQLILDPFMGSGTTLVAAKELGREAIGIDMKKSIVR